MAPHPALDMALRALKDGRDEEAARSLAGLLAAEPDNPDALYLMASVATRRGERAEAARMLERAVALRPRAAEFRNALGNACVALGRTDDAIAAYRAAVDQDPAHFVALNNLGAALRRRGALAEAVQCWRQATLLKRGSPWHRPPGSPEPARAAERLPTFTHASAHKLRHDVEQFRHLRDAGLLPPAFEPTIAAFEAALAAFEAAPQGPLLRPLDHARMPLLAAAYNRLVFWRDEPALAEGALAGDLPVAAVEEAWAASGPGIVHVDGLLRPAALAALRRFCLEATVWFDVRHSGGYVGSYINEGFNAGLLLQIGEELRTRFPAIFRGHALRHLWAYKYDARMTGIGIHADEAAVNVNFWITPDAANLDPDGGGLVVYDKEAPRDWDFATFNNDVPAILRFVRESGARAMKVPYRQNRAVIFNSDLFHRTDDLAFAPGYGNRRINVTMLFGDRHAA